MVYCHNCGHVNSPDSIFCGRCAAELRATQAKLTKARQIFPPPQDDFVVNPQVVTHPTRDWGGFWPVVLLLVLAVVIIWIYGRY